jgi:hypothetical protein
MAKQPIPLETVRQTIGEFKELIDPAFRSQIDLTEVYRCRSMRGNQVHWPDFYDTAWGRNVAGGVYLHFDEDDNLLYVGKAVSIGARLACYYVHANYPHDRSCRVIDAQLEAAGGSGIRVIPLDGRVQFLTPALEWFLIFHLNPPLNTQGRNWALQDT